VIAPIAVLIQGTSPSSSPTTEQFVSLTIQSGVEVAISAPRAESLHIICLEHEEEGICRFTYGWGVGG